MYAKTSDSKMNMQIAAAIIGAIGLIGASWMTGSAGASSAISDLELRMTKATNDVDNKVNLTNQVNDQQDKDIVKLNENIMIVNDNVSQLLIKLGVTPKQIKP